MFRTVFPFIIGSSKLHFRQKGYVKHLIVQLFEICLLPYVQFLDTDDGRKDLPKHVERFISINNLRNRCISLVVL